MNLLLVEDDENKLGQLRRALDSFGVTNPVVCRSLQSGLRAIRNSKFDLVLLDMTLPTYDQGPDEPDSGVEIFGGEEFLRQIRRFKINTPVVIVTMFESFGSGKSAVMIEDLDQRLREQFPDSYEGLVYYHSSITEWRIKLAEKVTKFIKPRI